MEHFIICVLNFRAHSKWFICCGDPVMYIFYYYYFLFFFNVTQITFFFVMQYAMSTLLFIFLMSKETLFQICQNCNQYSPPAAKICKYEGCNTMFPSKQFNWGEIDNMGMTNPTHQRELLEKRVTINTTLKKLKYHELRL